MQTTMMQAAVMAEIRLQQAAIVVMMMIQVARMEVRVMLQEARPQQKRVSMQVVTTVVEMQQELIAVRLQAAQV